jgi:FlaA1/EpsC-like NDP-sugar epimerase
MKKILVTGANGQLGNEMRLLAEEHKNFEYFFTDVAELDICDEQAVMDFVSTHQIDVIVNCAAYTAVDKAEDNVELCDKLNHVARTEGITTWLPEKQTFPGSEECSLHRAGEIQRNVQHSRTAAFRRKRQ